MISIGRPIGCSAHPCVIISMTQRYLYPDSNSTDNNNNNKNPLLNDQHETYPFDIPSQAKTAIFLLSSIASICFFLSLSVREALDGGCMHADFFFSTKNPA